VLNLTQRLTLGCLLLVTLSLILAVWVHRVLVPAGAAAGHAPLILWMLSGTAIAVAALTLIFVLRPIQQLSRDVRRIASGDLAHRTEWSSLGKRPDSFGIIANEMNRLAVRLRELRETESGRRQMEFQLSDAVLQSIFEPIIVTDSKGHVLKVNQSAAELLGSEATGPQRHLHAAGGSG
jgi:NtrC-family two-component system sensor histidine kinase KinB